MADNKSGWVLPEKWSEDLVDENGNKLSKRYLPTVAFQSKGVSDAP
jgi:hypothetical protein